MCTSLFGELLQYLVASHSEKNSHRHDVHSESLSFYCEYNNSNRNKRNNDKISMANILYIYACHKKNDDF